MTLKLKRKEYSSEEYVCTKFTQKFALTFSLTFKSNIKTNVGEKST